MPINVLITGGAGFIGSHLCRYLWEERRSNEIRILDNLSSGSIDNLLSQRRIEFIKGDICNHEDLSDVMIGIDTVFHLAAQTSVRQSWQTPEETMRINVSGTANVLLAARRYGVRRVVIASSAAVYGPQPSFPIAETALLQPCSPYGASKMIAERQAQESYQSGGPDYVCLRLFNIYGPSAAGNRSPLSLIPHAIEACATNRVLPVDGSGLQTRDFVHVADVVRALWNAALAIRKPQSQSPVNIGSGVETSVLEIIKMVEQISGATIDRHFRHTNDGGLLRSVADLRNCQASFDWQPKISLEEGLKEMWAVAAEAVKVR